MNIFTTEYNFKDEQQKEDFLHMVSILKITLHKLYHKDINILDYTDEKKILDHYNDVLQSTPLTNNNMKKFHKIRKRLI